MSNQQPEQPKGEFSEDVMSYMVDQMKVNDTPFQKELRKKADIIVENHKKKLDFIRENDMMSSYTSGISNILEFCRSKCDPLAPNSKGCLKNCSAKYLEQIKMLKKNKVVYDQEIGLDAIYFNIPSHRDAVSEFTKILSKTGQI